MAHRIRSCTLFSIQTFMVVYVIGVWIIIVILNDNAKL